MMMKLSLTMICFILFSCNDSNVKPDESKIEIKSHARHFKWSNKYNDSTFTKQEAEDLKLILESGNQLDDTSGIIEYIEIK